MGIVTRKFIDDMNNIYSVRDGVIIREDIKSFIKSTSDWAEAISRTGHGIGWCSPETVLMVTEYDRVYRISRASYEEILGDEETETTQDARSGVMRVEYNDAKYSDEYLNAEDEYKHAPIIQFGRLTVMRLDNLDTEVKEIRKCVLSCNKDKVYTIDDNILVSVGVEDCFWVYEMPWRTYIGKDELHTGCLEMTDCALLISYGRIEYIDAGTALELMNDTYAEINKVSYDGISYTEVRYNSKYFTDEQLNAKIKYPFKE